MAAPSTTEIMYTLGRIEATLESVLEQAKKTNGRVTKTEEFINAMKAAEAFRKEQQPSVTTQQGDVIVQATAKNLDAKTKLYITMTGVLSVVAAYLVGGQA